MLYKLMSVRSIIAHIKVALFDYLLVIFHTIRGMSICYVDKNNNLNGVLILRLCLSLRLQCVVLNKVNNWYNSANGKSLLTHSKLLIQPLRLVTMSCILVENICLEIWNKTSHTNFFCNQFTSRALTPTLQCVFQHFIYPFFTIVFPRSCSCPSWKHVSNLDKPPHSEHLSFKKSFL